MLDLARRAKLVPKALRLGDAQPQLVRELKGRWKGRNLAIAVTASLLGQLLIYLRFESGLPRVANYTNRYCVGTPPVEDLSPHQMYNLQHHYCLEDSVGNLVINWELWWLDLFTWLTAFSLIILLVAGTYVLISDLSREEQSGTLSFIRLSPRSVTNLLVGKILGVPILVYTVILLGLPLHLGSGIAAGIPISLILGFYLVVVASCAFFFSLALLYGLVTTGLGSFQSWLGTGVVLFFLVLATKGGYESALVEGNPFDWLALFYPGKILPYLVGETPHSLDTIGYFNLKDAMALKWYGFSVWNDAFGAIALLIINYAWWTYWTWQGLIRRFRNPKATLLSKEKSYWLTGSFTVSWLGFMSPYYGGEINTFQLTENFTIFFGFELVAFLLLMVALSPHRQTLQDWARYRHQKNDKATRNMIMDLMRGEESPATGAIALNLLSHILITIPALIFLPLGTDRWEMFVIMLLTASVFLVYACVAQLVLLMNTQKREVLATVIIGMMMFVPTLVGTNLGLPNLVSFLFFPIPAIANFNSTAIFFSFLTQWVVIIGCSFQLSRQLKKFGESETKVLFSEQKTLSQS